MSEISLVKSSILLSSAHLGVWGQLFWLVVFVLPLCLWHITSDVYGYFRYGAPTGQIWYVFSKLFGLYGALLIWYQAFSTLLKNTCYSSTFPSWTLLRHRYLGGLTLLVITCHIAFFVTAVSLREETFAWNLLLPDFRDFYHTAITIGLIGFAMALMAVFVATLRGRFPNIWKVLHRAMLAVVTLGLVHGFLIGTETRYGLFEIFYCSLMVTFLGAAWLRWREARGRVLL